MHYLPDMTPERLLDAHRDWNERYAVPLADQQRLPVAVRTADRPLRLGLVSADLGCHPVGQFVSAWLPYLDPGHVQVVCYSDRPVEDELAQRLKAQAAEWRDVRAADDETLAATIHDDRIDILCDLAGHTRSNRLLMFSRRPAMVQASWIGYVGTTGLEAIDYLIADRYLIPEGDEPNYRERVLRMPDGWLCYAPPPAAPDVSPPPCLARGQVTFGCFNNPAKITPAVVATWSEILRRVPGSRLLLKFKWFNDPGTREHFWALFARHGIEAARVELKGWSPQADHLGYYGDIDPAALPPARRCGWECRWSRSWVECSPPGSRTAI
jgi:predicted O-linked N-acetylglucosamine transferase (SPINDLY family)